MIQRSRRSRQAGFIRKSQTSKISSIDFSKQNTILYQSNCQQFSPFKDQSPEPIQKILQTYRVRSKQISFDFSEQYQSKSIQIHTNYNKAKQKRKNDSSKIDYAFSNSCQDSCRQVQSKIQQFNNYLQQRFSKQQIVKKRRDEKIVCRCVNKKKYLKRQKIVNKEQENRVKSIMITQTIQQIKQIKCKPEQINLSLAQAFNLHCHKMKDKLQRQRQKFSKSKIKDQKTQVSRSLNKIDEEDQNQKSKNLMYFPSNQHNKNTMKENKNLSSYDLPKMINKSSNASTKDTTIPIRRQNCSQQQQENNKENCHRNSNISDIQTSKKGPELKATKFFIPTASRSKPITPRQAYQHSLKKWKQLPQIVARQKQRQKQAKMRERLCKMRAHSLEVRNKLKR